MFGRLLILIAVINVCQCRRHHRRSKNDIPIEDIFEDIYEDTIYMDKTINKMSKYENNIAFDSVENSWYSRKILIKGFNEDKITVKIKHRVMYTKIENIYKGRESLEDIKVLPINLNTKEAFYEVKESKLYIHIPFSEQCEDRCHIEINEHLITVPQDNYMSYTVMNPHSTVVGDNGPSSKMIEYVAGNANNAQSGNEIDNLPKSPCAIMIKPNRSIKINENYLRFVFGDLPNTSFGMRRQIRELFDEQKKPLC